MIAEARPSRRSALARDRPIDVLLQAPGTAIARRSALARDRPIDILLRIPEAAVARKRAPTRVLSRMHEARA
jgi:hypothetical protein